MLPIAKFPRYLSPSSLMAYEGQPNKFYLQRMAPDPFPYDPQGAAAAVGSAFDAYVKCEIAGKLNIVLNTWKIVYGDCFLKDKKHLESLSLLELMLHLNVDGQHKEMAQAAGRDLFQRYKKLALDSLDWNQIEINKLIYIDGIPIKMKGDAAVWDDDFDGPVPLDWKVIGYTSASGASPKKGYRNIYESFKVNPSHKSFYPEIDMETIDPKWAVQLAVYGWGEGIEVGTDFPAYIDALVVRPKGMRVARYRAWIKKDFQLRLKERFEKAWEDIRSGSFVKRLGNFRGLVELGAENENWWS